MADITSSTLVSSPIDTVKSVLQAASGLSKMNFVDNFFPNFTGTNFQAFPFTVITLPEVEEGDKFFSNNVEFVSRLIVRVHVEWDARTALPGFLDAVIAAVYSNRSTFIGAGLNNLRVFLNQPDDEFDTISGKRVAIGEVALEYETELDVE